MGNGNAIKGPTPLLARDGSLAVQSSFHQSPNRRNGGNGFSSWSLSPHSPPPISQLPQTVPYKTMSTNVNLAPNDMPQVVNCGPALDTDGAGPGSKENVKDWAEAGKGKEEQGKMAKPVKVSFLVTESDQYIKSHVPNEIVARIFKTAKDTGEFRAVVRLMGASDKYRKIGQDVVFKHVELSRATLTAELTDVLLPKCTSYDYDETKFPEHKAYRDMIEEITLVNVPNVLALRYWIRQTTFLREARRVFVGRRQDSHAALISTGSYPYHTDSSDDDYDDADHRTNHLLPKLKRVNLSATFLGEAATQDVWEQLKDDENSWRWGWEWTSREGMSIGELLATLGGDSIELCVDLQRNYTLGGVEHWLSQQSSPTAPDHLRIDNPTLRARVVDEIWSRIEINSNQLHRGAGAYLAYLRRFGSLGLRNVQDIDKVPSQLVGIRPLHLYLDSHYEAASNIQSDQFEEFWQAMLDQLIEEKYFRSIDSTTAAESQPRLLIIHSPPPAVAQAIANEQFDPVRHFIAIEEK